jgi:hypothetical protein
MTRVAIAGVRPIDEHHGGHDRDTETPLDEPEYGIHLRPLRDNARNAASVALR